MSTKFCRIFTIFREGSDYVNVLNVVQAFYKEKGGGSSRQGPFSNIVNISRNFVDNSINFMSRIPIIDQFSPSPMFQFRRPRCRSSGRRAWCWWLAAGWSWPAGAGAAGRTQPSPGGLTTRTSKVKLCP